MEHGLPQMAERAGLEIRSLRRTPLNQILTAIRL
jgi:hypothetical protein